QQRGRGAVSTGRLAVVDHQSAAPVSAPALLIVAANRSSAAVCRSGSRLSGESTRRDCRRPPAVARHSPPFGTLARWSKRIRPTGPTCQKTACLHFPRQIAALKHLHTIDPKRTIRRQA
ncbi:hypothetical protein, partial [Burkholderia cepacia]|uniref:hypothetical protein n=1 Tax=Burkholderia cepacia TaxID=292 RepID=UPI001FBC01C8